MTSLDLGLHTAATWLSLRPPYNAVSLGRLLALIWSVAVATPHVIVKKSVKKYFTTYVVVFTVMPM